MQKQVDIEELIADAFAFVAAACERYGAFGQKGKRRIGSVEWLDNLTENANPIEELRAVGVNALRDRAHLSEPIKDRIQFNVQLARLDVAIERDRQLSAKERTL